MNSTQVNGYFCTRDTRLEGMGLDLSILTSPILAPITSIVGGGLDVWKSYLQQDTLTEAAKQAAALELQKAATAAQQAAVQAKLMANQQAYDIQKAELAKSQTSQVFTYLLAGGVLLGLGVIGYGIMRGIRQ